MAKLRIVNGRLSRKYNHFLEYRCEKCEATNTRLMGVVAFKLRWAYRRNPKIKLHQVIHVDFSEYGIDEYLEYFTDAKLMQLNDAYSFKEFTSAWEETSGSLGGRIVNVPLAYAIRLIDMALETNLRYTNRQEASLREFRDETLERYELMREAYLADPEYHMEFTDEDAVRAVSLKKRSVYETINYFIMRLVDRDYAAVKILSDIDIDILKKNVISRNDIMTLIRNKITKVRRKKQAEIGSLIHDGIVNTYDCESISEEDYGDRYRYMRSTVIVDMDKGLRNVRVVDFKVGYEAAISDYEVAMQLKKTEYITVYKINVPFEEFDLDESPMGSRTLISPVGNGMLCTLYNKDNLHLNSRDYRLEGDVFGFYLITIRGELVIMSSEIVKISVMENDLQRGTLAPLLDIVGRYKFETQVFKNFCDLQGMLFEDIIR